ncbi:MAG TPA: magnesium transporter CorA family protein [Solimonas sp.]|nr:magnesium transporter CorA family protein [Solimonas sp.]
MKIFHFVEGEPLKVLPQIDRLPAEGLVWIDLVRDEEPNWECWAEPLLGVALEPQHVADGHNPTHPSFFDGTPQYDMLIFEGLGPSDHPFPLATRTAVFYMFKSVLLTVRAPDNVSFGVVEQRLLEGRAKAPKTVFGLAHLVLDTMVDRYMKIREPLDTRLTHLQDELLNPNSNMNDWRDLLEGRREARKLESLSEGQLEALDAWRRGSCFEWTPHEDVRMRDLAEHVNRVLTHAGGQERDVEAAVQLHFASMSHRTNRVVQTLTVMSAIFFPLTLITGIYGMNFDNMPELHSHYGYYIVLAILVVVGGALVLWFKRRGFL